ncbi:reverse transcriptase domain-containing protein [Tanacetum coccineum]
MDLMISIGQRNTLAEYLILSGADNRPPMLDKDLVAKDLWEKVQLLMQGTRANTSGTGMNYPGQQRVVKCFNCQGEGHMARQCPKLKRKRDAMWFREKVLLVEAQGNAKVVLMANLSSYELDVLFEVPISDNTNNDMLNQSVEEMLYSKPSHFMEHPENKIHSDSNIIPYSQYLTESQNAAIQDTNYFA